MTEVAQPRLAQVRRRAAEVRTPGERLEGVRRIVVARDDRLGDVVLTLPAVDALRRAYPEARLALMVRPVLRPLAQMVDGVDEVLEAGSGVDSLRRTLVEFETDLLVCVSRRAALSLAGAMAGVRHRIGTSYRAYSALFSRRVRERRRAGERHELEYALSFAHRAGASPGPERFPLRTAEEVCSAAEIWVREHDVPTPFVLVHPGSGGSCPAWPPGHFVHLAALLADRGVAVLWSIGPADCRAARELERAPEAVRAQPRTGAGIPQLAALARLAGLVVSNSTGPLHLAAALGVPTLGFYAPWRTCGVARWGPYAENGWALVADSEEARQWPRQLRASRGEALLGSIPPELAADTACALLAGRSP